MFKRKPKSEPIPEGQLSEATFKGKPIRRVLHDDEWYFSVIDVIGAVTESDRPSKYWSDLKSKLVSEEGFTELSDKIGKLKMPGADGKEYPTDAANVETIFRIIQSVPSPKAEQFKKWLAKAGYEKVLEAQNPDIAIKRAILDYKLKGRDEEWIEARVSSIVTREALTSEWARRGINKGQEYARLTNLIHEKTFDMNVNRHEAMKGLQKKHNLRDHMTNTELLFIRLGEASTKDIAVARDARGYRQNEGAAREGGQIAGNARKALEEQTRRRVVSSSNYLTGSTASKELPNGGVPGDAN